MTLGYYNNTRLTKERFIYDYDMDGGNGCVYRTGDLGRYLSSGEIMLLGRQDKQVKINGNRVDLSEIESTLCKVNNVVDAVATLIPDNNNKPILTAYIIPNSSVKNALSNLKMAKVAKQLLLHKLPEYMQPQAITSIKKIPLTPNGKIDYQALPRPKIHNRNNTAHPRPVSLIEKELMLICSELFNVDSISVNDNFFHLGGDSITSMQLAYRAKQKGIEIEIKNIYQFPTIAFMATKAKLLKNDIKSVLSGNYLNIAVPKSPIQGWFFEERFHDINHFNQSLLLDLDFSLNFCDLNKILHKITQQHDVFDLKYEIVNNAWIHETGQRPSALDPCERLPD